LHAPHIGATALPVQVEGSASLPDGTAALSATASTTAGGIALTLINRHFSHSAEVHLTCSAAPEHVAGRILTAQTPQAQNSAAAPDLVAPAELAVAADGAGRWRVEVPPHAMATLVWTQAYS
jgi:alpha-N-arabinofuranosidase